MAWFRSTYPKEILTQPGAYKCLYDAENNVAATVTIPAAGQPNNPVWIQWIIAQYVGSTATTQTMTVVQGSSTFSITVTNVTAGSNVEPSLLPWTAPFGPSANNIVVTLPASGTSGVLGVLVVLYSIGLE